MLTGRPNRKIPGILAGTLRHRITIQSRSTAQDSSGGQSDAWTDFAVNVRSYIRPLSSHELIAAKGVQSETSHEITIRYRPDIIAAMRAVYNGRYFNLGPPRNTDERNIELIIPAVEGENQG